MENILVANWKMNLSHRQIGGYFKDLQAVLPQQAKLWFAVAYPFIAACLEHSGQKMKIGSQNFHFSSEGAFTGEVSLEMLEQMGCGFSLVGHSERRALFGETDLQVAKKVQTAQKKNMTIVLCCGETLEEREMGLTEAVLQKQLGMVFPVVKKPELLLIAYEPVWAIGTGLSASGQQAQHAHGFIRRLLQEQFGHNLAAQTRLLYGGSVNAKNIGDLVSQKDVNGGLVGGASIDPKSFADIYQVLADLKSEVS